MRRRLVVLLAGVLVVAVGIVAAAVVRSQMSPPSSAATASCSPRPCADAGGYRMEVRSVQRTAGLVRLEVTFEVAGRQSMHAVPDDFRLLAQRQSYRPYFNDRLGCAAWPRTPIPDGGRLGPKALCFRPPDLHAKLTLQWDPDLGITEYFSSGYAVALP